MTHREMTLTEVRPAEIVALPALMDMTPPELRSLIEETHSREDAASIYMQMFYVFLLTSQHEAAAEMQSRALQLRRIYRIKGKPDPKLRLLVVMGPGNMQDNTPIEFVLHGCHVQTDILYLLPDDDAPLELPAHDVTFIAIGESGKNVALLKNLADRLSDWPTPVINHPRFIRNCARDTCYQLLRDIAGVVMPPTLKMCRGELPPISFPITIRPIDTQGGEGLERVEDDAALQGYLAANSAQNFYVAQFVNYRSADGQFRKMRIVLIDGVPHICHLAISSHWMVHYLSAGMAESEGKRAEEQLCMESFETTFAVRFSAQLTAVALALQLDYVTIDCAVSREGDLLVFEVDSRGIIHAADPVHIHPYKPAVMQKAFDAFENLLLNRAKVPNRDKCPHVR